MVLTKSLVRLYGRDIALPELHSLSLPEAHGGEPDLEIKLEQGRGEPIEHDTGMQLWADDATLYVVVPDSFGPLAVEHLVLDHAVPIGLAAQGDLVLHGAGVSKGNHGALLLGRSGRGKSVTSQHLAQHGWRLLSDDAIRVEVVDGTVMMWPGYDGVRLHKDSFAILDGDLEAGDLVAEYGTKRRVSTKKAFSTEPVSLHAVFVLGTEADALEVATLGPARLLSTLAESAFQLPASLEASEARLAAVEPLVSLLSGYELKYRRSSAMLSVIHSEIADRVG